MFVNMLLYNIFQFWTKVLIEKTMKVQNRNVPSTKQSGTSFRFMSPMNEKAFKTKFGEIYNEVLKLHS